MPTRCTPADFPSLRLSPLACNGAALVEGVDYTVSYVNNVNVGTAIYNISGVGRYMGTKSGTFAIIKATPLITASPAASDITIGQALSASILSGGTANTAGTFAFTTPSSIPKSVGTYVAVRHIRPDRQRELQQGDLHG